MATYERIAKEEMESFLFERGFKEITPHPDIKERVYSKLIARNISLRVYSSITASEARDVGKDAIRVCLVTKDEDGNIKGIGKTKRVNRVKGWKNNLDVRIQNWEELLTPRCRSCGSFTVEVKGKYGKFYGCTRYPRCWGSLS